MEKQVFERVLCESWDAVARQRYHYNNAVLGGDDAAQAAAELMLRQFNDGQFEGRDEKWLRYRFFELARRCNARQFRKQLTREGAESVAIVDECEALDPANAVEACELIAMIYGEDAWIADGLAAGYSLSEIARNAGMSFSTVRDRNKRAKERAQLLNV